MSDAITTLILFWVFFGFTAVAIAAAKKLHVVLWIFLGPPLGPLAIYLVLWQAAARARAGAWSADGSTYYGGSP
jgi:hypothetical protein